MTLTEGCLIQVPPASSVLLLGHFHLGEIPSEAVESLAPKVPVGIAVDPSRQEVIRP